MNDSTSPSAPHANIGIVPPAASRPKQILRWLALGVLTVAVLAVANWIYDALTHKTYISKLGFAFSYNKDWLLDTSKLDGFASLDEAQRLNANHFTLTTTNPKCANAEEPTPKCAMVIRGYLIAGNEQSLLDWVTQQTQQSKQAGYSPTKTDQITIAGQPASRVTYSRDQETMVAVYLVSGNKQVALGGYPANSKYRREFDRLAKSFRF